MTHNAFQWTGQRPNITPSSLKDLDSI